jgi:diguanylate cyclase (GGDEF)-like protein/PAS domain S-box-containing protein
MTNLPSDVVGVTLRRYMRATLLAAVALVALTAATLILSALLHDDPAVSGAGWPTTEVASNALFFLLALAAIIYPRSEPTPGARMHATRGSGHRSSAGVIGARITRGRIASAALLLALIVGGIMLVTGGTDLAAGRTSAAVMLLSLSGLFMAAGRLPRIRSILVTTGALMGPTSVAYLLVTSPDAAGAPAALAIDVLCGILTVLAAFALTSLAPSGAPAVVLRTYATASAVILAAGVVIATPAVNIALSGNSSFASARVLSGIAVLVMLSLGLPLLGWFAMRVETWRALAVSGTDGVMVLERSGRIESVDVGTEELTGWRASDLRGVELATLLHDGTTELHERLAQVADSMTTSVVDEQPLRMTGPNGSEVDVSMRLLPTITADGLRIIVTLTDAGREAEYRRRAFQDPLTGVLNRRGLLSELDRALDDPSSRTAVMFVDLDHFKQINDLASHAAGDEALRHVATSLQHSVRVEDRVGRVGRVGGDEFVCVLSGIRDDSDLLAAAERLETELLKLIIDSVEGQLEITVSIGAAIAGPGCTSESLLARADTALHQAKRDGRNRIVLAERADADRVVVDARSGTASTAPHRRRGDPRRDRLASADSWSATRP